MEAINVCKHCGQVIKAQKLTLGEVLEERIQIIIEYADEHPEFDRGFIDSLCEQILANGTDSISPKQMAALNNIIDKFGME